MIEEAVVMFRNGRSLKRQINSIRKSFSSSWSSNMEKGKQQSDMYSLIPRRIDRSPTDILKALAETVKRDPTACNYQIPDDPFFYPTSNYQMKKRILSVESGRKSARWIIENCPDFFNHSLAEPTIKTFLVQPTYDENSEVTEGMLIDLIQDKKVSQAIAMYQLLDRKGIGVSKDTRQSLLELVCFYNSSEISDEKDVCGKWYEVDKKTRKDVWTNDGFVKNLFDSLEPECPLAYAALIQGMLKHNKLQEAMELFLAGEENKIEFPASVYNMIIENVPEMENDPFKRFAAVEDYLKQMAERRIKPNLGTLNSVLKVLSEINQIPVSKKESFICKLLVEFDMLNISPSLGSYYYILKMLVDQTEVPELRLRVAWGVVDSLGRKKWSVRHPSDFSLLHFAMSLFSSNLRSWKLCQALMDFYSGYDHYKFLNTDSAERQFFDQYLSIVFNSQPTDRSMKVYRDLVPTQTFLDVRRYATILRAIIQEKKLKYLEEIWKDVNKYLSHRFFKMSGVLQLFLRPVPELKAKETPEFLYEVALVLFKLLDNGELESRSLENMLIVFARFEDGEKSSSVLNFIIDRRILLLEPLSIKETFVFALSKKNIPLMKNCLQICYEDKDPKLKKMGKEALPLLDEADQKWLNAMLSQMDNEEEKEKNKKLVVEEQKADPQNN